MLSPASLLTADFCYPHITAREYFIRLYNRDTHKAHAVGLSGRVVPFKHQLCISFKDPLINPVNT